MSMNHTTGLISSALALAVALPVGAQMMNQGDGMGGGRRTMINLVSPADSPTQIRRGTLMFGQHMSGLGQNSMGPGVSGPGGNAAPVSQVMLRLYLSGVSDANGLLTNQDNHFSFKGQLTTATGNTPITINQTFALNRGAASLQVPVSVPSLTGRSSITIDDVAVTDAEGSAFAVPGIVLAQPTPQGTPHPIPGGSCTSDSGCNDGDPNTTDICMPIGCRHMPDHMGPGMSLH